MGLFSDTLRDARRPIMAGMVRRAVDEGFETELPDEAPTAEPAPGMQTVFRFNKAGPAAQPPVGPNQFREASFRAGGESLSHPSGDPLTAGEERIPPATRVLQTGTPVRGDRRVSNLETGQDVSGSPGKVTAANAVHASESPQSVVSSGLTAASSHRETRSSGIPEGSEAPASPRSKTSWRQEPGRDVLPETSSLRAETGPRSVSAPAPSPILDGQAPAARSIDASARPEGATTPTAIIDAGARASSPAPMAGREPAPSVPSNPAFAVAAKLRPQDDPPPPRSAPDVRVASAEPHLVIGRIDVVVLTAPSPVPASAPGAPERGFLSRNYLKRL